MAGSSNPDPTSVVTFGVTVVESVKLDLLTGGKSIPYGYLQNWEIIMQLLVRILSVTISLLSLE